MPMFSGLFGRKTIDEFATRLVADFAAAYAPEVSRQTGAQQQEQRLIQALAVMYTKARHFGKEKKLGFFGKARLGNNVKWAMQERGYAPSFVEETTRALLLSLSRKGAGTDN